MLAEAIQAGPANVNNKSVLLIDDLIESGSTLRHQVDFSYSVTRIAGEMWNHGPPHVGGYAGREHRLSYL